MILRKPYAIFIKYFKLMHGIMSLLIIFLLTYFYRAYSFFNVYSVDYRAITNVSLVKDYFNSFGFFLLFLILILNILIFIIMVYKKKPIFLYFYNFIVFVLSTVLYYYCFNSLGDIGSVVLPVTVSKAYRDFFLILTILQAISLILAVIRTIGFDIKRFDFGSDLQSLDISEEDSEEIEVSLDFDIYEYKKIIRNKIRNIRYVYYEHKFLISLVLLILIIFISFIVVRNKNLYISRYKEGNVFNVSGFSFNVVDSYIVDSDINGNKIVSTDGEYAGAIVVVKLKVKSNGLKSKLNTGYMSLKIDDFSYDYNYLYAKELSDLGETYYNQEISSDYQTYILTFEILNSFVNKKIDFVINDKNSFAKGEFGIKNNYVRLNPKDLRVNKGNFKKQIGEVVSFKDSFLNNSSFVISKYEVSNKFKLDYKYCYREGSCIDSNEYVSPLNNGNYYKALLRITGKYVSDDENGVSSVYDITTLLNNFGSIYYYTNDWNHKKIISSLIKPKVASTDDVFIEVPYEVIDASEVYLKLKVRNHSYKYVLK